jgi:acyl dehydratase
LICGFRAGNKLFLRSSNIAKNRLHCRPAEPPREQNMLTVPVDKLKDYIDQPLGTSEWVAIDQERINAFADVTLDHQFIHIDAEKAKATPFGTTIAHGYLSLSLVSHFLEQCGILPEGTVMAINYGSDKVRFLQPVTVNSKVRGHGKLLEVSEKSPGQYLVKTGISVEIEGHEKPALVAEILSMFIIQPVSE